MRSILRTVFLAPALMAAAILATNAARAETTLKVPFSFTVAGQNCPAGLYSVQRDSNGTVVTLKSKNTSQSFNWVLSPGAPAPTDTRVILKFDEMGQTHALRSVQFGSWITSTLDKKTNSSEPAPTRITPGE